MLTSQVCGVSQVCAYDKKIYSNFSAGYLEENQVLKEAAVATGWNKLGVEIRVEKHVGMFLNSLAPPDFQRVVNLTDESTSSVVKVSKQQLLQEHHSSPNQTEWELNIKLGNG